MNNNAKTEILQVGNVSYYIQKKYFPNDTEESIRDKLEEMNLNRHMPIEVQKIETILFTPQGILMQIKSEDSKIIGLWEGRRKLKENPYDCVRRTFSEEIKLEIEVSKFEFIKPYSYLYKDENGDQIYFYIFMYMAQIEKVPQIKNSKIISFEKISDYEIHDYQKKFIKNALVEIKQRNKKN